MKSLFTLIVSCLALFGYSQNSLNPVTWQASYHELSANEGELIFTAIIEKKWHIYSQRPTDAGPIPTSFVIKATKDFELVGLVEESNAHEEFVAAFDAKVYVFDGTAVFKQKIKRKNKLSFSVNATVEYMTCNDKQCLPPKTIELPVQITEAKLKTKL